MGGYALCTALHISGPLAMAVAGLLIGNHGVTYAMSDTTRDYVIKFWEVVDELLNSALFLLIGLEMIVLVPGLPHLELALAAIVITLAARAIAVSLSTKVVPAASPKAPGAWSVLVWGGLRGGISIALALSLPTGPVRDLLLAATFAAVLFSVLVQRATLGRLIERGKFPHGERAEAPEGDG
jgi:CPA1 family monovalent cation:H+ antiporter